MRKGTVIARGGLNLRDSPKTGALTKTLRRGSSLDILAEETWLQVRASDGSIGWVLGDLVEREPAAALMPEGAAPAATAGLLDTAPSDVCVVGPYHNVRFAGAEILADADFLPLLDRLNDLASTCGVEIHVTSSFRDPDRAPNGAIVPPATRSNHFVGHAIDMNVKSSNGFFNSAKLKRANLFALPAEVRDFIQRVRDDPDLRWGGDFSPEDPVHIDDGLNRNDPARWQSKFELAETVVTASARMRPFTSAGACRATLVGLVALIATAARGSDPARTGDSPVVPVARTEISLSPSGDRLGPITARTPFSAAALRSLFPAAKVTEATGYTEGETYPLLRVVEDQSVLLELRSADGLRIHSVEIMAGVPVGNLGVRQGASFVGVFGEESSSRLRPWHRGTFRPGGVSGTVSISRESGVRWRLGGARRSAPTSGGVAPLDGRARDLATLRSGRSGPRRLDLRRVGAESRRACDQPEGGARQCQHSIHNESNSSWPWITVGRWARSPGSGTRAA